MTISQELARFIVDTEYEDLPSEVVAAAKRFLIDTLGLAIGGATTAQGRAIQAFLGESSGTPEATVVGTRLRASRLQAALANGTLMRALELEDTLEEAFFHSAPGAIGSTLALLERHPCSGRDLLAAVAVAYETGVRIARAVSPSHANRGYHPTATIGSFGASAASARLLGLDEGQTAHALGIAGLQAAGIMQSSHPSWRYLTAINGGRAAHLGVTAALMARSGFPGADDIFEGPLGFCAMHSDAADLSGITEGLGSDYVMPIVGIKLFPSSRPTHSPIAGALELRERHGIDPQAIDAVTVKTFAEGLASADKPAPRSELDGQGSIQYLVAVALARGRYTLDDVNMDTVGDPAVRRVLDRVTLLGGPRTRRPPRPASVHLARGRGGPGRRASTHRPGRLAPRLRPEPSLGPADVGQVRLHLDAGHPLRPGRGAVADRRPSGARGRPGPVHPALGGPRLAACPGVTPPVPLCYNQPRSGLGRVGSWEAWVSGGVC